jgi:hypothetical protein
MKRKLAFILAICLVMIPGLMQAQESSFGIKGGVTWSNLYIDRDDLDAENARTGFHAGVFSQFMFSGEIFGIQPEVLYSTKGSEAEYAGVLDQRVTFNLNYIDVPLLLVFRPIPVVEFHAGPYVGYLLESDIDFTGTIDGTTSLGRGNFEDWDYGLVGGVALNLGAIKLGARYNLGLNEIAVTDVSQMLMGSSKHQYAQVYLAIQFPGRRGGIRY